MFPVLSSMMSAISLPCNCFIRLISPCWLSQALPPSSKAKSNLLLDILKIDLPSIVLIARFPISFPFFIDYPSGGLLTVQCRRAGKNAPAAPYLPPTQCRRRYHNPAFLRSSRPCRDENCW